MKKEAEERPLIYLIGIGMGAQSQLTGEALDGLEAAQAVMGADRMLDAVQTFIEGKPVLSAYKPSEMVQWLHSFDWEEAALVLSGDTGFYSGAQSAASAFDEEGWDTVCIPGISSLSYFCSRLGRSWQDVHVLSVHGRDCDIVANVKNYRSCFILLGGQNNVGAVCRLFVSCGLGKVLLCAGENFTYEEEHIVCDMTPAELIMEDENHPFGTLSCLLVENPDAREGKLYPRLFPRDGDFIRGQVPMTKETVRRLSLEKLCIGDDAVCFDIGSGTGSVAVDMGLSLRERCRGGQVYAIEKNEAALELMEANFRKFHGTWEDIHIVKGEAPEALEGLPAPTHAFIGGSGGYMEEIIKWLLNANPTVRIVANAITLETVAELTACMKKFAFEDCELLQVMAAPVEVVGSYHMPKAQNPVYIAVMQHPAEEEEGLSWQEL